MIRYIRYAFLAAIALCLVAIAAANRDVISLSLFPQVVEDLVGWNASIQLPLFIVVFGGIVAGLLIGFVWEWLREAKHRAEASRQKRAARELSREVEKLKGEKHQGKDEVLALLDNA